MTARWACPFYTYDDEDDDDDDDDEGDDDVLRKIADPSCRILPRNRVNFRGPSMPIISMLMVTTATTDSLGTRTMPKRQTGGKRREEKGVEDGGGKPKTRRGMPTTRPLGELRENNVVENGLINSNERSFSSAFIRESRTRLLKISFLVDALKREWPVNIATPMLHSTCQQPGRKPFSLSSLHGSAHAPLKPDEDRCRCVRTSARCSREAVLPKFWSH
uniref:Uncharacterized protein n=1 Tax=Vespula pensylvanica TaxID=30213 RepID=A0A834PCZ3_VESPE|nr:hypothetical protein H0235_003996 [Vespula pensylvanica]